MLRRRLEQESGYAVVTAIIVIALMIMFGLTTLAASDNETQLSGKQRVKETAYNVAEAALNAELFSLSHPWPASASNAYPDCSRGSTDYRCPSATTMAQGFTGTDFSASTTWTVTVRDNLGSAANYYSKTAADTTPCQGSATVPCAWDSNADGALWLRAQATVAGQTRTLVTLVRRQTVSIQMPIDTVVSGKLTTTNRGRKVIIDEKGCGAVGAPAGGCLSTTAAPVAVRCTTTSPKPGDPCLGWDPTKGQVSPNQYTLGYTGNDASVCLNGYADCVLTADQIDALRRKAQANGTYYASGCPSNLNGTVVFIEDANTSCTFTGGTWNSANAPGMLIVNKGTLTLGGNFYYFGVIYAANSNPSPTNSGNIINLTGTATIQGSVVVEGPGGVAAGASKFNIIFDPNAISNITGFGDTATLSQNTYRELPAGQ